MSVEVTRTGRCARGKTIAGRLLCTTSLSTLLLLALPSVAHAQSTVYWDPNKSQVGSGGNGDWNTTTDSWSLSNSDVLGDWQVWVNNPANPNNAVFGTTSGTTVGTINVTAPITVHNMTFQSVNGWTLNGGTITLAGTTPTITTTNSATINSVLAGTSGLTKTGGQSLTLTGNNTFSGGITVNQGLLHLNGPSSFTGGITISGGSLRAANDASFGAAGNIITTTVDTRLTVDAAANRTVSIGSGTRLEVTGAGVGSMRFTGSGNLSVLHGVTLSNAASNYTGTTTFSLTSSGQLAAAFNSIGNLGEASSLGAPTTPENGTIIYKAGQYFDTVSYTGDGDSSNRNWSLELASYTAILRNAGTGTLTITGNIEIKNSGDATFSASSADLELLGVISGGAGAGVTFGGGAGRTLRLESSNTFTGAVTIGSGTVVVPTLANAGVVSSLGAGSIINLGGGGILSYTGGAASTDRDWVVASSGTISNNSTTGALSLSGDAALSGGAILTFGGSYAGGTNVFTGVISGSGGLASSGSGMWELIGVNTRTGTITMNGGTLRAGNTSAFGTTTGITVNAGTLDLNGSDLTITAIAGTGGTLALGSGNMTINPTVNSSFGASITGSGGLTKNGLTTLTLTGANTYSGPTYVNGGTLMADFSQSGAIDSNILSASSSISLSGGSILYIKGATGEANSQTIGGLNITSGSNTVRTEVLTGGTLTVNLGTISRTGGMVNFDLVPNGSSNVFLMTANADGVLGGWAMIDNADYAKVVGGRIVAFDNNDYTDIDEAADWDTLGAGQFVSDDDGDAFSFSGTVDNSVQLAGLHYNTAANSMVTVAAGRTLGIDGAILVTPNVANFSQTITGAGSITGSASGVLGVRHNGTGTGSLTIAATIVDNGGPTGFTKGGAGIVRLVGVNSYTGPTTLSGGTLQVESLANGGVNSAIGASSAASSNLVLEGGTFRYIGAADVTTDRGFTLVNASLGVPIIQVDGTTIVEFQGQVTSPDDQGLTKTGTGTLTLSNDANTYTGVTTIRAGALAVDTLANGGVASGIGASSSDPSNLVLDGGELRYTGATVESDRGFTLQTASAISVTDAGATLTLGGVAAGPAGFTKNGAGTLKLAGDNTFGGDVVVNGGVLRAGSAQAFGSGIVTVNAATLDLDGFSNSIGGLRGAGAVSLGSATLTIAHGYGSSFSGTISGAGGLTKTGTGVQTFVDCNNNYNGPTTISRGTLSVNCLADGGFASGIGASPGGSENLIIRDSSVLLYTGGTQITNRGFTLENSWGYVDVQNSATMLTFTGNVVGTAGSLVKRGSGTLVLSGTNTYGGNTSIEGGILRAGSVSALGTGGGRLVLSNVAGAALDMNNHSFSFTYLEGGGAAGGNILTGGGTLTLTLSSGGTAIYAGAISGGGGLVMNGQYWQRLTNCGSTYTGATTVSRGILEVSCLANGGAPSAIGGSTNVAGNLVINGGVLRYLGPVTSTDRLLTLGPSTTSKIEASGTGALVFTNTGAIAFSSPGTAQTIRLGGSNTDNNTFALQIANNSGGVTSFTKEDGGTWILTNQNSNYSGVTRITGGVLGVDKLANGNSVSSIGASDNSATNLVIGSGSTLRYTGAGDQTDRRFTLERGTTAIESSGTGAVEFTNTAAIAYSTAGGTAPRTISLGGTFTGDNIMGAAIGNETASFTTALAKNGAGKWILTGNNTYTGLTNVNQGMLVIGNGGTTGSIASTVSNVATGAVLGFNRSDTVSFAGTIQGTGSVHQLGAGTTVLTGANTYTGGTTISAGTLRINGNQSAATGLTSVASGATLGGSGIIGGSVTVANGGRLAPGNSPGVLTINGDLALNDTSQLDFEFGQAYVPGLPYNDLVNVGGNLTLDGTLNVAVSSGGSFGPGVYRMFNYGGTLTDNGVTMGATPAGSALFVQTVIANQVNLVNTAGLTLNFWDGAAGPKNNNVVNGGDGVWRVGGGSNNWTDVNGLVNADYAQDAFAIFQAAPGTVTVDNSGGNVQASGLQFASTGYVIAGGPLTLTGTQAFVRVGDGSPADTGVTATVNAVLAGSAQLVKDMGGTLVLAGANTYTGGTAINGGTIRISQNANLGDNGGVLSFNGGTLNTAADMTMIRTVNLAGTGTFDIDPGTALILNGGVSGGGGLVKAGSGILTLAADSSYTGGTTIAAGTLQVGNGGAAGAILGDVANSGLLQFARSDDLVFGGTISGSGSLAQTGAGVLTLTADHSYTGTTSISAGTLQLGNGGTTGSVAGDIVNSGTLVFNRSNQYIFAGTIAGAGDVRQAGSGTTILTADNSYTGPTTVQAGTLLVNGDQSAATGLAAVDAGATLGGSGTIGGSVAVTGTLAPGDATGPGTLTIRGNLDLAPGARLAYEFGQSNVIGGPLNDLAAVGGDLDLDGTIDVTVTSGGSFDVGLYRVISYGGVLTDNGLAVGSVPAGSVVSVQTSMAGQVNLINSTGVALSFWDGAAGPKFDGAVNGGDGVWQNSSGNDNWANDLGTINAGYSDGTFAIFAAAPGTVTVDNSLGAVSAAGLQFASDGYVIAGDALTLTGPQSVIRVGDGSELGLGYTATINAVLTGATQLVKTDNGTLVLSGANTYTGGTRINAGTLRIAADANLGGAAGALSFDGGTLNTTADIGSNRAVSLIGDGTVATDAGTVLTLSGAVAGAGGLKKDGAGTLILSGANSYGGDTVVAAGSLLINGSQPGAAGLTSVASGATLGGTGVIGGTVALADGATLAPGSNGVGTLTINGGLTLGATSVLDFELGQANTPGGSLNDLVNVAGDLTLDGTVNVSVPTGGGFGLGVYRLFTYGGTLTNNGLTLGTMPSGTVTVQTSIAGQVNLVNSAGLTMNFWDGAAGAKNDGVVTGGSGTWQNSSGNDNWTDATGGINGAYAEGAFAIFGGAKGTVTVDNSLGAVTAAGLQFAVDGYTVTGGTMTLTAPQATIRVGDGSTAGAGYTATIAASLSGDAQLVKTDAGTLVLSGANSYTGGTVVSGGTVEVSADANLGAASGGITLDGGTLATSAGFASGRGLTLAGNGTISTAGGAAFTLNGLLAGSGALTKAGAGTLLLTADNSGYTGATTVAGGTLAVQGSLGGEVAINASGRLEGRGRVGDVTSAGIVAPGRDGFGTLTIGRYAANNGTLEIETALGGDASPTDRLVVAGGTSGATEVVVLNRGGFGAQTVEGIKIIDLTGGTSSGTFTLKGDYSFEGKPAVIAGAFGYRLVQGGVASPSDGDWYLRSSLLEAPQPNAPVAPLYQPGVPLYESYAQTLQTLNRLSTLQARVGNRHWSGFTASGTGLWGRIETARHRPEAVVSTSGTEVNTTTWALQAGFDRALHDSSDGTLIAGINGRYGTADARVRSRFGGGEIETKGYSLGAALTWYDSGGFYADAQAQVSWFRSDLDSDVLGSLVDDNHGSGEAFSLELGKRALIGGGFSLTPQTQIVYANVRFDRFADLADAAVSTRNGESLRTRWGLSLDHQKVWDSAAGPRRSHVYGIANLTFEWLDGTAADVSGTPLLHRNGRLRGELGLGGSYSWRNGQVTIYADVSADTAMANFGDSNTLRANAGLRVKF